ncbi:hypothetical protein [Pelagicoccus mobilis]|uniref:Uncharacterized protein n=1 Tax=Pelagicoccus mobilis TaxID=415221 RepID=A0A934S3I7_9BACT|nr:hypothetical protein [Pelagicoccus mobilis]MBK1880530.1 hypothetical protein [Pelagicoccus mobilis]
MSALRTTPQANYSIGAHRCQSVVKNKTPRFRLRVELRRDKSVFAKGCAVTTRLDPLNP